MIRDLKKRIAKLEVGVGDVRFMLDDGSTGAIRRKYLLDALAYASDHPSAGRTNSSGRERMAQILLHAREAEDGSRLHELAQALAAGPVPDEPTTGNRRKR